MNIDAKVEGTIASVRLEGRFTFEDHSNFKSQVFPILSTPGVSTCVVDFAAVNYLDSSSLGLLLIFKEKADLHRVRIILVRPRPSVLTIMRAVQFDNLFEIQD